MTTVLWNDPGAEIRYIDAGYQRELDSGKGRGGKTLPVEHVTMLPPPRLYFPDSRPGYHPGVWIP